MKNMGVIGSKGVIGFKYNLHSLIDNTCKDLDGKVYRGMYEYDRRLCCFSLREWDCCKCSLIEDDYILSDNVNCSDSPYRSFTDEEI